MRHDDSDNNNNDLRFAGDNKRSLKLKHLILYALAPRRRTLGSFENDFSAHSTRPLKLAHQANCTPLINIPPLTILPIEGVQSHRPVPHRSATSRAYKSAVISNGLPPEIEAQATSTAFGGGQYRSSGNNGGALFVNSCRRSATGLAWAFRRANFAGLGIMVTYGRCRKTQPLTG